MPTKRLPDSAHLDHLKRQAKDLLRAFRDQDIAAFQRVREFHPKHTQVSDSEMPTLTFALSDAQLALAREYGYVSWPRLKAVVAANRHEELHLSHNDRLPDGPFKQAIDFMDAGDEARLKAHFARHPRLVHERASFEGGNYFANPTLLEFLPENPIRQGRLPTNALAIAKVLLSAGAKDNVKALNDTLMLAASGRVCREQGLQEPLLRLLTEKGADPNAGMSSALAHNEFAAARVLVDCGATYDLAAATALDDNDAVTRLLPKASQDEKQLALALCANAGRAGLVAPVIAGGADPNRYNPPGGHTHCTPLHSAVAEDQYATVVALVENGADTSMRDIHNDATALGWAEYLGHTKIADFLKSQ